MPRGFHIDIGERRVPTISNTVFRSLFVLGAAVFASLPIAANAAKTGDVFDDWKIQCETPQGLTEEVCHAFQVVSMKEKNQNILHVAVGYPPNQDTPIVIITVPLGVALQTGVQVKVDEGTALPFPFNVCLPNGCQAGIKLESPLLDEFKKGSKLTVTFGNLKRQGLNVPVSLKGMTKALAALKQ
jgi:invasion protein IalB